MKTRGEGYIGTNAHAKMLQEEMQKRTTKRHHDYWCYSGVAFIGLMVVVWLGAALTNGTWSWS